MESQLPSESPKPQPKISQRMLVRFAIGLFICTALLLGYQWWKGYSQDPDLPREADTSSMLAAIELLDEGSQAVVIKGDGEVVKSPDYKAGNTDKELVWRPDGHRLFFVSDREDGAFNIYRWNLASNKVMRRSIGTRSQSSPSFAATSAPGANESALITSGGVVLEFDPRTSSTRQVLPPVKKDRGGGEEGAAGQFEQLYQQLGTSFRIARWSKDKRYVAAIMRREDDSEILIIQDLEGANPPMPVIAGQKIEVELNSATGEFAFLVNGFRFHDPRQIPPDSMKNGKVVLPFTSIIGQINPEQFDQMAPILPANNAKIGFQRLAVSPDGQNVAVVAGSMDSNLNFEPRELIVMPAKREGGREIKRLLAGKIYEPSWHPNSRTLAFIQYDSGGKRGVFTVNTDGSGLTDVTKGKGDFANPLFSPQAK